MSIRKSCSSSRNYSNSEKAIKARAKTMDPTIRIGKNGITDSMIDEIRCQLKKRKLVKIKLLKAFVDDNPKDYAADLLVEKTGARVIHKVGFVIVLHKP